MDMTCSYPGCKNKALWRITLLIPKDQLHEEIEMPKFFCDDHKNCVEREKLPSGFWQAVINHHAKPEDTPGAKK